MTDDSSERERDEGDVVAVASLAAVCGVAVGPVSVAPAPPDDLTAGSFSSVVRRRLRTVMTREPEAAVRTRVRTPVTACMIVEL